MKQHIQNHLEINGVVILHPAAERPKRAKCVTCQRDRKKPSASVVQPTTKVTKVEHDSAKAEDKFSEFGITYQNPF